MREIKFRVWDKTYKKMYYPDYPYSWDCDEHCIKFFVNSPEENLDGDVIPMQFTGLKDKNGKEIYEGDIVKDRCRVFWSNKTPDVFVVQWDENTDSDFPITAHGYFFSANDELIEVIGNIYENPSLLDDSRRRDERLE